MKFAKPKLLVYNPNTTQAMTEALKPVLEKLALNMDITYQTAEYGVPSINNLDDARISKDANLPYIAGTIASYNAVLVACYSPHPLVPALRKASGQALQPIIGIFEASIATCLSFLSPDQKFGILTTGAPWESVLNDAVAILLGSHASGSPRFIGTQTTGMNANELHDAPRDELEKRIKEATKRLLKDGANAICLGCAGMAGLDSIVREACEEALGDYGSWRIRIVDGVVSGALQLEAELRALRASDMWRLYASGF